MKNEKFEKDLKIRVSESEKEKIDNKVNEIKKCNSKINRTKYCIDTALDIIENGDHTKIDLLEIKNNSQDNQIRNENIHMALKDEEKYDKINSFSLKLGIEFGTLVRYFALNGSDKFK